MDKEYVNIQTGEKLGLNSIELLKDNAMLKDRPDLWVEWDFEKNNELGLDVWSITKGSNKKVWWYCDKFDDSYEQSAHSKVSGIGCPFCSGKKASKKHNLLLLNPSLASEWHPIKNGDLTPSMVLPNSNKKIWWICEKGHEWEAILCNRNGLGRGCPYCSNQKILKGFNDMWTTNPDLARLLANPEDGYKYSKSSGKRVNWVCGDCGETIRNKCILDISYYGLSCPKCKDYKSQSEKFFMGLLDFLEVDYENEKQFKWSNRKRYDFYIPKYNMIIEVHGKQHYERNIGFNTTRSLEEEQENDNNKLESAIHNGIDNYIIIDASKVSISKLKKEILKSDLSLFLNLKNIDWNYLFYKSKSSKHKEVLDLHSYGYSILEISEKTKYHKRTVKSIIKKYNTKDVS